MYFLCPCRGVVMYLFFAYSLFVNEHYPAKSEFRSFSYSRVHESYPNYTLPCLVSALRLRLRLGLGLGLSLCLALQLAVLIPPRLLLCSEVHHCATTSTKHSIEPSSVSKSRGLA